MPASEAVLTRSYTVGAILKKAPDFLGTGDYLYLLYPYSMYEAVTGQVPAADAFWFRSSDHAASYESMGQILMELGNSRSDLEDLAANGESQRAMVTVVNVFSYGFIILISLISMTNVFNTISTSIALRRREFAMLRSVGAGKPQQGPPPVLLFQHDPVPPHRPCLRRSGLGGHHHEHLPHHAAG